jgi:hypothetical protein
MTFSATDITFEPEEHLYWYGMERIPSVSEILRPLTERYIAQIPEVQLNWKRDLGLAVHKACELLDKGQLDESSLDDRIVPYLEAYKTFTVDHRPEWSAIETIVFEPEERYCGTLDRAGEMGGKGVIVDLKTSNKIQPSAAVQLWAYALAYEELLAPSLYVLQLKKDGKYALKEFTDYDLYSATWDALLSIYRWNQRLERQK